MKVSYRIIAMTILVLGLAAQGWCGSESPSSLDSRALTAGNRHSPIKHPIRDESDEVVWSEDFENGAEGWTHGDLSTIAWHKSDFNARNGEGLAWWCGDTLEQYDGHVGYDNSWLQYLQTPVLDLSQAARGLTLTFDSWWLLEDPRIKPPAAPYDGWDGYLVMISNDGGNEFEPLLPLSPEYTAQHLSSADNYWKVGDWPGWVFHSGEWAEPDSEARPEVDWAECSFDLSNYTQDNVVIRWILVSDRRVAAPYENAYLQESGVLVDNILIADDDGTEFLSNKADDDPAPAELTALINPAFGGDYWELTEESAHGGDWSMWHDDAPYYSLNYLDSPPITLPEGLNLHFEFWVWCDMPDDDSDGDGGLDDFYQIYLTSDSGATWLYQAHDYARVEAGGDGWTHYLPGLPFGDLANIDLDLTQYAGQTIQLRWLLFTDGDDGGGDGRGLFIDDIEIIGENRSNRDAGMMNLNLPYPTNTGYRTTGYSVEIHNLGLRELTDIRSRWAWTDGINGKTLPITRRPALQSDEFLTVDLSDYKERTAGWTPLYPGVFDVGARTIVGFITPDDPTDDDEVPGNDSTGISGVRVWPNGLYEFGYDNRTYQHFFDFNPGTGAAARFTPANAGLDDYSLAWAHFKFNRVQNQTSTFTLHILGGDDSTSPGAEIYSLEVDVPVDSCLPNNMTVPLWEYAELQGLNGEFWLWAEIQRDDYWPQIIGDDSLRNGGRFFSYNGILAVNFNQDLMIHAAVVPGSDLSPSLAVWSAKLDFGEVYVGNDSTKEFSLWDNGLSEVNITSVSTRAGSPFEIYWPGATTLRPGEAVVFDIFYNPTNGDVNADTLIIESDDQSPPVVALVGTGLLGVDAAPETIPVAFGLSNPRPNPFNSRTIIGFKLDRGATVDLALFDLNGRRLVTLFGGEGAAGFHSVSLNAEALPAGIYLLRLQEGDRQAVKKLALVK